MMPANHDVFIVPDVNGFKVRPAVAVSTPNSPFKMRNLTDSAVAVHFPTGLMTTAGGDIGPKASATFTVSSSANGVYDYTVEVDVRGVRLQALGESGPRIIIDP